MKDRKKTKRRVLHLKNKKEKNKMENFLEKEEEILKNLKDNLTQKQIEDLELEII